MQVDVKFKVLHALAERNLSREEVRSMYEDKYDGARIATMVRHGWAEWIRPNGDVSASAIGLRITDVGREILK